MTKIPSIFVAYPSQPPSLSETIEEAIKIISATKLVTIDSWKSTKVSGKFVISAICKSIEEHDVFICDLTYLNHNVLFELGFAIAKQKRVWLLHNPTIEDSAIDFQNFKLLTTLGYSSYMNSKEISRNFFKDEPYKDLGNTIYKEVIEPYSHQRNSGKIILLKSAIETDASIKLSRRVHKSTLPSVVDDPSEVRIQTLTWYAEKVYTSFAVVAHFMSTEQKGQRLHNAKNSFVSGLSFGLGKHLLMIAHEPYMSPIDYRELLQTHQTALICEDISNAWLDKIEKEFVDGKFETEQYSKELRAFSELQKITIGDPVAEHESELLVDYFVQTAAYNQALSANYSIMVGRKGTGKSAILFKLASEIVSDTRNHVCQITPVGYELDGVISMVQQAMEKSEKGFLIESFWKFLIYTELAKSIYEYIKSKPLYYELTADEQEFVTFVENNSVVILQEFSVRLEAIVNQLQHVTRYKSAIEQRMRISELMHENIITKLRLFLGQVLEKKHKVAILIDNLDKTWNSQQNIVVLCDLLYALMDVSRQIYTDFQKSSSKVKPVNLSIIIFLRSDIFQQVLNLAPEKDKLNFTRIVWDDQEVLLKVLEERFLSSNPNYESPSEIWSKCFCKDVMGISTRDYLMQNILPRPRDLIYLVKYALTLAVNRRHSVISENDIIDAQKQYAQYALDSLEAENGIQLENLKELLYEFIGSPEIVERNDILASMKKCKIPDHKYRDVIELLSALAFIGVEVDNDRFEFQYSEKDEAKYRIMARRLVESRTSGLERFKVAQPFHSYLEIKRF
jgi:hypothetical protein